MQADMHAIHNQMWNDLAEYTASQAAEVVAGIARAVTLTDSAQGVIRGYVFIWGSPNGENGVGRDSYGTYFDLDRPPNFSYDGSLPGYPICLEHGRDPSVGKQAQGKITRTGFDNVGMWFEAQLDRSSPVFARTIDKLRRGEYYTSSSTADHMSDFTQDGAFENWMLDELSLVENPSQAEMPVVRLIRSAGVASTRAEGERDAHRASRIELPHSEERNMNPTTPPVAPVENTRTVEEELAAMVQAYGLDAVKAALDAMSASPDVPAPDMPMTSGRAADFMKSLRSSLEAQKRDQENKSLAERLAALEKAQQAANNAAPPADPQPATRGAVNVSVSEPRKYWDRSLSDLAFVHKVMRARGQRPSDDFIRAIAGRAADALDKKDPLVSNPAVRSVLRGVRSDEIVTSTNSGNGDEWVGVLYDGTLWEKARNNRIFQQLQSKGMRVQEVPDGSESVVIFTEGSDPTVYTITQSADLDATSRPTVVVPVTAPGTGQVVLTPGYLGMAIAYTSVFEEDALVGNASQLNNQMQEKAEETIEQLFINGDPNASLNVNYDGGTATTQYFMASGGARLYPLVTATSYGRSGGTLDENDYRLTLKLFPSEIRTRKQQMAFIIDPDTHNTSLDIAAIKTDDVRRTNATITAGELTKIYGVDVLESGFMPLTASDGKVTYNAAGTLGGILGIYAPYWAMGWKRQVTFETDKDILAQTNLIVATFRLGFKPRGAGASTLTYNLTIA